MSAFHAVRKVLNPVRPGRYVSMNLCQFLRGKRSEIIDDWVQQLSRATSDRYSKLNLSELRETVARAYDGNYSVICNHDWQPIIEAFLKK